MSTTKTQAFANVQKALDDARVAITRAREETNAKDRPQSTYKTDIPEKKIPDQYETTIPIAKKETKGFLPSPLRVTNNNHDLNKESQSVATT